MIDKRDFSPGLFSRPLAGLCGESRFVRLDTVLSFFFVTWLFVFFESVRRK